jgi:hypothetical protein
MNREEKSVFRWIWIAALALAFAGGLSFVLGVFGEAAEVAQEEFGPRALLKKYEQFKDQSAMLDKKVADIGVYEVNLAEFDSMDRKEMDRFDKAEKAQLKLELAGLKASYNKLAAEYNSNMSKFNYEFCNVGTLPKGATEPLPREFKPYINK